MATGGEKFLAQIIAFAIFAGVVAVVSWLFAAGKRAITGTPLSKNQNEELKKFKKDQTEDKPK